MWGSPKRQCNEYNSGNIEEKLIRSIHEEANLKNEMLVDLRGKTSLLSLAGACEAASLVISVDAGPLHIAAATNTKTIAIVGNDSDGDGASPIRLWMPRSKNLVRTVSTQKCTSCLTNKFKNDECIEKSHMCMEGVHAGQVIELIKQTMINSKTTGLIK